MVEDKDNDRRYGKRNIALSIAIVAMTFLVVVLLWNTGARLIHGKRYFMQEDNNKETSKNGHEASSKSNEDRSNNNGRGSSNGGGSGNNKESSNTNRPNDGLTNAERSSEERARVQSQVRTDNAAYDDDDDATTNDDDTISPDGGSERVKP